MMNSATGDSRAVSRLIVEAAAMNSRALTATKRRACRGGITPAGISRPAAAGVFGVDATVGPAVEAHGRIAGEDHAEQDLHRAREPPRSVVRPGGQRRIGVDETDGGKRHGEDRMGELHQRKVFRYGIHAETVFAAAKIAKAEGNRKTSSDCRDGPEKRAAPARRKGKIRIARFSGGAGRTHPRKSKIIRIFAHIFR